MANRDGQERERSVSKGWTAFVREAGAEVRTDGGTEAVARYEEGEAVFVDVRETTGLVETGRIPGVEDAFQGMIEFLVDPERTFSMDVFAADHELVFYSATGERGFLAAHLVPEMGVAPVAAIKGRLFAWTDADGSQEAALLDE